MSLEDAKNEIDAAFTRKSLKGLNPENAFAGSCSFLRRRYSKDLTGVDLAITGIPFDQAVTHRPGARFGPRAIREASTLLSFDPPYDWPNSPLEEMAIADYGDLAFDYAHTPSFPEHVKKHIRTILDTASGAICLGGDHSITLPILTTYAEKYCPLSVIHFDAHFDLWPDDNMERIDHGTFFYKAVKMGLVAPTRSIQLGIRTHCDDYHGVLHIDARIIHENRISTIAQKIKERVGQNPTYLTFGIDCLDSSFAPGTGTPVWGGLHSWQVAALLREIAGINMVGDDLVEVAPAYDSTGATALAASHIVHDMICLFHWAKFHQ